MIVTEWGDGLPEMDNEDRPQSMKKILDDGWSSIVKEPVTIFKNQKLENK